MAAPRFFFVTMITPAISVLSAIEGVQIATPALKPYVVPVAAGVLIVIDSDAHRTATLQNMRWGVATARRAWLTREDVVNTRPWAELRKLGKKPRK